MKERLRQFMLGRYGVDQFGQFLNIASIILLLLGILFSPLLEGIAFALILYGCFRMFSRNMEKRSAENAAYNALLQRIKGWFSLRKRQFAERKTHRFHRCPSCKQYLRVPKGKGKISITCSKCHAQFVRKT
ncbi:MAG: hypothetical protein K0R57_1228 [Paenibacillaceae bacterium]|jgi:hypothetical protein|nr:hypothetical protein [Paenibacillaceae bacterium]